MAEFVDRYMNPVGVGVKSPAEDAVQNQFTLTQGYAQTAFNEATQYMNALEGLLGSLSGEAIPDINEIQLPSIPDINNDLSPISEPELTEIPTDTVAEPAWVDVENIDLPDIPDLNEVSPSVDPGPMPNINVPNIPDAPSVDTNIDIPNAPDVNAPSAPSLSDIDFPSPPIVTLPTFEMELPNVDWKLPQEFSYNEANYTSDIWAKLLAKVLYNIDHGGTGLDAIVEQDIYDRARARQELENERLYHEAENYFEARGYSLPPGALAGRLAEISREISRNNTELSEKIAINQAELAQKNTQFFIDKGVQLEGMLRDFFNQQAQRALTASIESARVGIEIVNTAIRTYNTKIEKFNAYTRAFEARTRAALTEIEKYRIQIDACGAKAAVQRNLVEIYNSQLKALFVKVDIYKAQVASVTAKLEAQRTAIAAYEAQVRAYVANMEGNRVKYEMYNTRLKAAQLQTGIYEAKIRAYVAKAEALNSKASLALKKATNQIQQNQAKTDVYKAKLAGYISRIQALAEQGNLKLKNYSALISEHTAIREDFVAQNQVKAEIARVDIENARLSLQKAVSTVQMAIEKLRAVSGLQIEGTKGIMNVAAQLAASAMNSVTASAHLGATAAVNVSDAFTHNASIYESHPFKEVE